MKIPMRGVILEGNNERWQDLLSALGDYGEFQPERSSGTLPNEDQKRLLADIDGILTQTENWSAKLQFEDTIKPIIEYIGPERLEVET